MATILSTLQEVIRHELRGLRIADLGLVEAVYPHQTDDDPENYSCDVRLKNGGLLLKQVPIATGHIGTATIPNLGDLVLLTFYQGDVNQPIIIGRLYNDEDRPPCNQADELIFRLPLHAADKHAIKAAIRSPRDDAAAREVTLEVPSGIQLKVSDSQVSARAGNARLTLNQSGEATLAVGNKATLTLTKNGDITLSGDGDITLKAGGDLTLEGQNIRLDAKRTADIQGKRQASLKGGSAIVTGRQKATLSGTTTEVGSTTSQTTLKGLTSFSQA
jgi:uncharacterized protein involved in type VI secretion and phage assembly